MVPFKELIASSASDKDLNLTKADPVNLEFFLMILTSNILPYSEKNLFISFSYQLKGRLPTYIINSIFFSASSYLVAISLWIFFTFGGRGS